MNKLTVAAVAAVVVLVAGGAGYFVLQHRVDQELAELKEQGVDVSYESLGFTAKGWGALNSVKATFAGQDVIADQVQFSWLGGNQNWAARNVQFVDHPSALTVAYVEGSSSKLGANSTKGTVSLNAQGIQLPLAAISDGDDEIDNLTEVFGADHVAADLSFSANYDTENLKFNYTFGSQLFSADINGAVGGVNFIELARKVEADPDAADEAAGELIQLSLGNFSLTLADNGLVEKIAAAQAKTKAISVDDVRGQWGEDLAEVAAGLRAAEVPLANQWADELDKLASSWKGISFSLNPAEPVPLLTLMMASQGDPEQLIELLNLEFSAL